ncbi:CpaE family protein [Virgibacillus kekensis]|uniref:CpaE family protein n=1 Tax=Virgibacillus kekensis TaxID=202261 RepID=A0ABV9DID5_9BACI
MISPDKKKQTVAVCSATGGQGRTSVTVNLAAFLAARQTKVTILDADLQFGDLAMALDIDAPVTLADIAEQSDSTNSISYLNRHPSGLDLIAAPKRPEQADMVNNDLLNGVMDELQTVSEVLFVETQAGLTDHTLQAVEKADRILVVTTPGMISLKNARLMIETLDALGMKDKVRLVVNQSTAPSAVKAGNIAELTKVSEIFHLPYDLKNTAQALDTGMPIVISNPKLEYAKAIERMAKKLFVVERSTEKKVQVRGLFRIKKSKRTRGKQR